VSGVLDAVDSGGPAAAALSWNDVELVLFVLYCYGEAIKGKCTAHMKLSSWLNYFFSGTGMFAYVVVPPEERAKIKSYDQRLDYTQFPLTPLGEIILRVAKSNIASWPHPSVPLQFFECAVRYHEFFQLVPECIPNVLSAFLDQRCVLRQFYFCIYTC
jgi:exportin-T